MTSQFSIDSLKAILDQVHSPEALDTHPWVTSAFVQETLHSNGEAGSPGRGLLLALERIFASTIPGASPRRGKRLDTDWGEFGLLAALYFAPLKFGTAIPSSLRDAWGRIDSSILLYVFGRADGLTSDQLQTYKLVGDEADAAPNSTLSDWHRKGLQQLAQAVQARETYLKGNASTPKQAGGQMRSGGVMGWLRANGKQVRRAVLALAILILLWAGITGVRVFILARAVYDDVNQFRGLGLTEDPSVEAMQTAAPRLTTLREDFHELHRAVSPFLWLGPVLSWIPEYGGDIAEARDLMVLGDSMLTAADTTYQAVSPMLDLLTTRSDTEEGFDTARLLQILDEAQPRLLEAQQQVNDAVEARARIDVDRLSPLAREAMTNYVDKALPWMQDGIVIANELPRLMGASDEGPKTYLLLAQNEDELRPTGGFITAAGTLLLKDGQIANLTFENSSELDNWTKAYPVAPWQLHQYMNSPVLVLRDTNWFSDFPTAALYAESLYAYQNDHSVDGVIALDQHVLVELLRATGPVNVDGSDEPITSDNVVAYMRAQKVPPGGSSNPDAVAWDSKAFINKLTSALLNRILEGGADWEVLAVMLVRALDEHHILIQIDNPALTPILVRRGWDGAVRPDTGDFLMVVDTNVGFNKTNAVVETSIRYDVDLSIQGAAMASLSVTHRNNAVPLKCQPLGVIDYWTIEDPKYFESDYPIDRCYYTYLRVYRVPGAELMDANPQSIPAEWMPRQQPVPPQVDVIKEEGIVGVDGYGLLKVVPGGESIQTDMRFTLPADVVTPPSGQGGWSYKLLVQKQPGTLAIPFTLTVRLPKGASILSMPTDAAFADGVVTLSSTLRLDQELEIIFTIP